MSNQYSGTGRHRLDHEPDRPDVQDLRPRVQTAAPSTAPATEASTARSESTDAVWAPNGFAPATDGLRSRPWSHDLPLYGAQAARPADEWRAAATPPAAPPAASSDVPTWPGTQPVSNPPQIRAEDADPAVPAATGRHRLPPTARSGATATGAGRGRRRPILITGRLVAAVVAAAVLAVTGIGWTFDTAGTSNAVDAAGNVGVITPPAASAPTSGASGVADPASGTAAPATASVPQVGAENILLVGADSRTDAQGNPLTPQQQTEIGAPLDGGGVNTDTLLVLHIPAGGGQATAISIPRDTWIGADIVNAPGVTGPDQSGNQVHYLPEKINAFYGTAKYYDQQYLASKGITGAEQERESDEAGRTMLIKVIQQFTGIKINHYAEVNLFGFYLMSEAIGGVPVCLNEAVDDHWSGADFPKGYQTVEGRAALAFIRQRHGLPGGDLDRIRREQAFLGSAANQILSMGTLTSPSKLAGLMDAANRSIVLDTGFDLFTFAQQMHGVASGDIHFATIPTTNDTAVTTTDALAADTGQVRAMFAALQAGQPLPGTAPVQALHQTTGPTRAGASASGSAGATSHPVARPDTTATPTTPKTTQAAGGYQVPCVN